MRLCFLGLFCISLLMGNALAAPREVSGIYPSLAMFNHEGECGTGAVVPWANRLWVITYAPHAPNGSSDKFYEITPDLQQIIRPESVGGTPANRMIHQESKQLFIGPYVVDAQGGVRVIPPAKMYGRLTANMRHLIDPANYIYYATMEEGFYEVNVHTLAVKELYQDGNRQKDVGGSLLPGYHGKGSYSGQGVVVYANNGERGAKALTDPTTTSGVLAQWNGEKWRIVMRNQFTEVTGPGGLYGNPNPETDPIWSIGWDAKSLIFMMLDQGKWSRYRLPKGSHSYDGAHGWNTEWPRIREIGDGEMLMTMHGTFWRFPRTMSSGNSAGIRPRSNYIKVIGDFCRWNDRVVFGCDDSAKSEFLNKRRAKGSLKGPGESNSNLWFVQPEMLDRFGPVIGRGCVWMNDAVQKNTRTDPYLFDGYDQRTLYIAHAAKGPILFALEMDRAGNGVWESAGDVIAQPGVVTEYRFPEQKGIWVRIVARQPAEGVYAVFQYANEDRRVEAADVRFAGLATEKAAQPLGGLVYSRGAGLKTLGLAAVRVTGNGVEPVGFYQMGPDLKLVKVADPNAMTYAQKNYGMQGKGLTIDAASALVEDDRKQRWRFPKSTDKPSPFGEERLCREVCTERDMLNICGTFYELPAENAGGFSKVRAIATHGLKIHDFCSWRGLLIMTGVSPDAPASEHIIRSADGNAAVWAGAVDDLWSAGKPRGVGGPWKETAVRANVPSDPYLMTGFDKKALTLSQQGADSVEIAMEIDLTGTGVWKVYKRFAVAKKPVQETLDGVRAYWVRFRANKDCKATATLVYR